MAPECCRATPRELVGEGGRGTSSSPFPQGELWGKGKPSGELLGELYIGEGEGGTLGEKQLSAAKKKLTAGTMYHGYRDLWDMWGCKYAV